MLEETTLRVVDAYWAAHFGCEASMLRPPRAVVVPHGPALADYPGVYVMTFGAAPVASAPPEAVPALRSATADLAPGADLTPEPWVNALASARAPVVIGPAWVGYADGRTVAPAAAESMAPPEGTVVRGVTEADMPAAVALRAACSSEEWAHGGVELRVGLGGGTAVGAFSGDALVALSTYEVWGAPLAHISVVVHPAYRGRGHAVRVVHALAMRAMAAGLVPQYRTLEANDASRAVARRLGFVWHASSLAVRPAARAT